jgi:hypothetical protein
MTRSFQEIIDRHRGPYLLCAGMRNKKGEPVSAWLKTAGPRCPQVWTNEDRDDKERDLVHVVVDDEDVVAECLGFLRDPLEGIENVCIFSKHEQQFVTTFRREDVNYKENLDGAAVPEVREADAVRAGGVEPLAPVPPVRVHRVPQPGAPSPRGGRYRFVKDAAEKLGTTPRLVLEEFKRRGAATVAEVAAALESSLTTEDPKALVASHATRLKAAGLLEKEAA